MYQVIEFYRQNLQLAREIGDRRGELAALSSLGRAYHALEEHDKALECYEDALKIARVLGDVRTERQTMKNINDVVTLSDEKVEKESQVTSIPKTPKRNNKAALKSVRNKSSQGQSNKTTRSSAKKQNPGNDG